jgi:7-cyano-7-deazaguanine synthase
MHLQMDNKKYAVLSLSGGMDSSTLLLHLLNEGYDCTCLSFDYGQKHKVELERATELVKYINKNNLIETDKPVWDERFPLVKHQIIKLDGLSQLLNSSLVEGGSEVPEGHYENENMKATVVPNRNMIFSSIVQSVALSIATKHNTECVIALGLHSGDHAVYPDTTEQFRQSCLETFKIGNWESHLVDYYTPYMETNKFGILEDGAKCCELLGLDFDEVYKRTNTSYKPIFIPNKETSENGALFIPTPGSGKWYSDYKSASSVERIEAFIKLGIQDPVEYADESGPVSWDTVVEHVSKVLSDHLEGQD